MLLCKCISDGEREARLDLSVFGRRFDLLPPNEVVGVGSEIDISKRMTDCQRGKPDGLGRLFDTGLAHAIGKDNRHRAASGLEQRLTQKLLAFRIEPRNVRENEIDADST